MSAIALTLSLGSHGPALSSSTGNPGGGSGSVNMSSSGRKVPSFPGGSSGSDPGLGLTMTSGSGVGGSKPFGSVVGSSGGGGGGYVGNPRQGLAPQPAHPSSTTDFEFKIRYKFIPRSLATVR
jgi:hypothetical protein